MKLIKFQLSIEHIWAITVMAGIFIFINTHPIRPHDFWWHITIGREILSSGKIPEIDIYSFTAYGQPYPSYKMFWLTELLLYSVYNLGGPALVVFVHSLIISSAYFLVFWICKNISNSWRIATICILFAIALGINDWNVRPQGISFLLASLFLLAIYKYQENHYSGWLIVFPAGMLVWVNSHGTFVIGLVLITIWLGQVMWDAIGLFRSDTRLNLWKHLRAPVIIFFVTILICLINPQGIGIIKYLKTLTGNSVVQNLVTEWAPPTLNSLLGIIFYLGLMGSSVILALSPRRPNFFQITTFLVFGLLGLKTSRGSVWFGMVMAPILAEHVTSMINSYPNLNKKISDNNGSTIINYIIVSIILLVTIITLPWFKERLPFPHAKAGLISMETPVKGTEVLLEENPPGRLFHAMSFGSYLIWAGYPQYQVFVDPRIELYSKKNWIDYLTISNASDGWERLLKEYGVNTLMLSPTEQPKLVKEVMEVGEWKIIYEDISTIIFERK